MTNNTPRTPPSPRLSSPLLLLLLVLSVLQYLPRYAHAILPTAAIDIRLPGTSSSEVITLLASQASFGGSVARYDQRHGGGGGGGGGGGADGVVVGAVDGVGVVPAFPPDDDPYLCNESEGLADYSSPSSPSSSSSEPSSSSSSPGRMMSRSTALLVPRGRCSFEAKALSAQRLGSSIAIVYGTLSSRYSLNYTNSSTPDAKTDDSRTRSGYTNDDVIWPQNKFDYDCDMGSAHLPGGEYERLDFVKLPGGYDEGNNDVMLTGIGDDNMCVKYDDSSIVGDTSSSSGGGGGKKKKSFASACESQRCLVTGRNVTGDDGGAYYEACCAWDLHIWLYGDPAVAGGGKGKNEKVTIPAVYITMEESSVLLDMVRGAKASSSSSSDPIVITVYERSRPTYNASAFLIWALGVFVAWASSYRSSHEIRKAGRTLVAHREYKEWRLDAAERGGADGGGRRGGGGPSSSSSSSSSSPASYGGGDERTIYRAPAAADDDDDDGGASTGPGSSSAAVAAQHRADRSQQHQEESLELTAAHAAGFLISSSCSLLILFFFKIYNVVKIMYAFGCSGAFAQVMVHPGLTRLCRTLRYDHPTRNFACLSEASVSRETARGGGGARGKCLGCLWSFLGPVSPLDVAAAVLSYGVGAVWLWVGFAVPHPGTVAFYWIVQNVFGMCMCMLFLDTIKLNAIKVGAVLLIVAFFYDIFFVFLTPFLTKHGESIMVNVATSGGPPKADPAWCEKYPFDANCRGGDPLPMLFAIPRIGDYQGGSSMLGLGDIVLPGLLLSFASRFDESKRLMGMVSGGSGRVVANNACPAMSAGAAPGRNGRSSNPFCFLCSCCFSNGYFGPVVVAYAIGLFMANAAVYIMEMGQPALLYLVPCCLGTMVCMGRRAGELADLWEGPRAIRAADALMYGEAHVESAAETEDRDDQDLALEESVVNEEAEMT